MATTTITTPTQPKTQVFGVNLETIVQSQNNIEGQQKSVPSIVIDTIKWLEEHNAVNEEGIFRVPGSGVLIQEIKKQYDEGKPNLSQYQSSDIHSIAGLLKLYLRELTEPLFIWRYYSTFIKVIKNPDNLQKNLHLRMLIYGLPKVNRDLVLYLITFLNRIAINSGVNKMSSSNLATVFAPNILRPQKETLNQIMEDSSFVTQILKTLIDEVSFISKQSIHLSTSANDVPSAALPKTPGSSLGASGSYDRSGGGTEQLIAKALYPYQASGQWHLPFKKDDQIILLDIKLEEGWLKGELNGKIGYFPSSYVEIIAIPPPNTPITLVPIPDLFDSCDFSLSTPLSNSSSSISTSSSSASLGEIGTTPPLTPSALQTTTTTTTTINTTTVTTINTTTITTNNGTPISASKSTSSNSLRSTPTSRSSNNLLSNTPPLPSSQSTMSLSSSGAIPISSTNKSGSNSNMSSPDLAKHMSSTKFSAPPPLSVPPPPLSIPQTFGSGSSNSSPIPNSSSQASGAGSSTNLISNGPKSGSFSHSASPDFTKSPFPSVQQHQLNHKLSFSGGIPPLSVPPPLLPSKLMGSQISSLSLSGTSVSPPISSSPTNSHKGGSFIELSTPPPPPPLSTDFPTIMPQPISTPVKSGSFIGTPLPIDLHNLPPPPFSPLSPEQVEAQQLYSNLPPPPPQPNFGELPPPPPPLSNSTGEDTSSYKLPPPPVSITNMLSTTFTTTTTTLVPPPPPLPKFDRKMSYKFKRIATEEEKRKRKERAEEMLSTEKTYVKQLTMVYDFFIEPLKKNGKQYGLAPEDVMNIFSCLEVILNGHRSNILKALEERMKEWDQKPQLGDIFVNNTSFIKLYKHYVNNFDKSIISLKQCKEKYPEFKAYMATLDYTDKLSGLSLESFLILPVQRLPRYVLLLQEVLKYTGNEHEDFNQLCEALTVVKDLTESINFKKSEEDNQNKIQQISDQIKHLPANCMTLRKRFIEEGILFIKKEKFYVFLFSDALIITKPSKERKKFKNLVHLQTASLNTTEEPNIFKLMSQEGIFKFTHEQLKEREHWAKLLKETIEAAQLEMIQSAFGDTSMNSEGSKGYNRIQDEKNSKQKEKLARELYESEEEYVEQLTYIQNVFLAPIKKSIDSPNPMVSYTDSLEICSNFETLLGCHVTFLGHLKERILNQYENKPIISDLFQEKGGFLKLYNYYVQNHNKQLQVLDSCIENIKYQSFAMYIKRLEADEKAELKVLLAEPLRRIPRYYLLVREILQYTRPKHDDHEILVKVVQMLKEQTDKFTTTTIQVTEKSDGSKSPITKYKTLKGRTNTKAFLSKDSKLSQSAVFNIDK